MFKGQVRTSSQKSSAPTPLQPNLKTRFISVIPAEAGIHHRPLTLVKAHAKPVSTQPLNLDSGFRRNDPRGNDEPGLKNLRKLRKS
jgi:hypothetical protein